jgi:phage shock protein PspC (stress-responsive transcriptional regulator)
MTNEWPSAPTPPEPAGEAPGATDTSPGTEEPAGTSGPTTGGPTTGGPTTGGPTTGGPTTGGPTTGGPTPGATTSETTGEDAGPPLTAFAYRHALVRPTRGRIFAGVCAAFGRATNTDPVLWRVVIAVLTLFGGIGLFLYLLGWILLPAEGDTAAPIEAVLGRGRSGTNRVLTVIVAVIVLITLASLADGRPNPGLLGALLLGGALLLLVRDQGGRGRSGTPVPAAAPFGPTGLLSTATGSGPAASTTGAYPPSPFAPHGPYAPPPPPPSYAPPVPPPPLPPRPKRDASRLGQLTFSLLLMVIGLLALLDLTVVDIPPGGYVAASLATIGLGLLIGAWFGRARGLIVLGIIVAIMLGAVGGMDRYGRNWHRGGGTVTWVPNSVEELQRDYRHDFGDATLDLSRIDFTGRTSSISASVDLGSLTILVPPNVDVQVHSDVNLGDAHVFGNEWGGLSPGSKDISDLGPDGAGGGTLIIDAKVDLGNLEVHR